MVKELSATPLLTLLLCSLLFSSPLAAQDEPPEPAPGPKRIGIVLDGETARGGRLLSLAKEELQRLVGPDEVVFPETKTLRGDGTSAAAKRNLTALLSDPEVSVVWAFGLLASRVAAKRPTLDKPVVAPFVADPGGRGLTGSTAKNLSHVLWSPSIARDLKALRELGEFKRITYIASELLQREVPELEKALRREADPLGITLSVVHGATAAKIVAKVPANAEAVYVGANLQLSLDDISTLAALLIERKLPSFSQLGRVEVERGLLMGLGSPEDGKRLARTVAINTDAILRGEVPNRLTTAFKQDENPVLNLKTAQALGLSLSWDVMSEAELIGAVLDNTKRRLNLASVVHAVSTRNLDLRANQEGLIASQEAVNEAIGSFLPRLDASLTGNWVDPDGASMANPERSMSWGVTATQHLINEPVLSNFSIQSYLLNAAEYDNDSAELDAAQAATVGYINILKAQTTEKLQRENVKTTRTELSLARVRQRLGTGAKSEVVRLESKLAGDRSTVIRAVAQRNIAEIELNRLLNRPLEERFVLADVTLESSQLMAGGQRLQRYMGSPEQFRKLREFIAAEAVRNAPELRAADQRLAAKDREVWSHALAPFVPQVSLSGSINHRFLAGGEGSDVSSGATTMEPNDFNWQVGLTASLPLWEGNARYARTDRARAQMRQLEIQRDASEQIIEANVRSALHSAGASFASIGLQRQAAASAKENLELVQEAYGRGKSNVIEVIDAQNQALAAQLNATNAVYDFLIDLLNVQRVMGRFEFSMSPEDVTGFFQRLSSFSARQTS